MAQGKPVVFMTSRDMPNIGGERDPELRAANAEEYTACAPEILGRMEAQLDRIASPAAPDRQAAAG